MMILVTGGTGFIGREFVKQLVASVDKKDVTCLAYNKANNELERSGRKALDALGVNYIEVDLVTGEGMEKVPRSPDIVFHLASITVTAERDHSINTVGTKNLIEAIQPIKPEMHFVFTSTICVNDKRPDFDVPVTESLEPPVRPCNEYGRKKLFAEGYLKGMAASLGFSLSIIRVTGVYGEGVRNNGLFDNVEKLTKKKSLLMRFNWPGRISIIHVFDMAKLILAVSTKKPARGKFEVYIPSIEVFTLAEMSQMMHEVENMPYKQIRLPSFFWSITRAFAKSKGAIERVLPHKLYDTFWQACILVNNEFWNVSKKMSTTIPDWKPIKYKDFYLQRKNKKNV
jgi:nucleoside-diphosphate-sugar epimerase